MPHRRQVAVRGGEQGIAGGERRDTEVNSVRREGDVPKLAALLEHVAAQILQTPRKAHGLEVRTTHQRAPLNRLHVVRKVHRVERRVVGKSRLADYLQFVAEDHLLESAAFVESRRLQPLYLLWEHNLLQPRATQERRLANFHEVRKKVDILQILAAREHVEADRSHLQAARHVDSDERFAVQEGGDAYVWMFPFLKGTPLFDFFALFYFFDCFPPPLGVFVTNDLQLRAGEVEDCVGEDVSQRFATSVDRVIERFYYRPRAEEIVQLLIDHQLLRRYFLQLFFR